MTTTVRPASKEQVIMTPVLKPDIKRGTLSHLKGTPKADTLPCVSYRCPPTISQCSHCRPSCGLAQGLVTQKARTVPLSTLRYLLKRPAFRETPYKAKVLALSLFVLRVLTDNSDRALSLDDLTFFANRFYGRSNFHVFSLLSKKVRLSL